MTTVSYFFSIAAALLMLVVVTTLLVKRRLRERHAILWLAIGGLALIAAIFPAVLEKTSETLGVKLPISLVFFIGIVTLVIISMQHSAELTELEEKSRTLAEQNALLAKQIQDLKKNLER